MGYKRESARNDYENARKSSKDSRQPTSKTHRKVPKSKIKAAFVKGMVIGAIAATGVIPGANKISEKFDNSITLKEYTDELFGVISDNSYSDSNGEHVDSVTIGATFKEMIEDNQYPEYAVVYATASALNSDYESDERDAVIRLVSGHSSLSEWLNANGYQDYKEIKDTVLQAAYTQESQNVLNEMVNEHTNQNTGADTSVKGIGGKW